MTSWWKDSTVYQIYPRSFQDSNGDGIGDLQGIIRRIPYLSELGIDIIWLSPIYDSPNDDNGYDIRNYREIHSDFGNLDDFKQLVKIAKDYNIGIMMDLVVNHTSDEHEWFKQASLSKESSYRDYYIFKDQPNNWESVFSGSAWQYNERTDDYYLHLFSKKQPDLNWENENMRKDIYDMMKSWFDLGIVGFRMDVINFIAKDPQFPNGEIKDGKKYADGSPYYMTQPKVHTFLREMYQEVLASGDYITVGETPGATPDDANVFTNPANKELSMIFTFEHMDVDGDGSKWRHIPLDLVKLKQIFNRWQVELHDKGWNSLYWNNHDQPRVVSRFGNDQKYHKQSAKMLAITLHMMQGTPYIYQGEEIGMVNTNFQTIGEFKDIESINYYNEQMENGTDEAVVLESLRIKSRDNARTPMQWDSEGGFTEGKPWIAMNPSTVTINVDAALADLDSIFYTYKHLITLRKQHKIIQHGSFNMLLEDHQNLFVYKRVYEEKVWLIISNFSEQTFALTFEQLTIQAVNEIIISNNAFRIEDNQITVFPYGSIVIDIH